MHPAKYCPAALPVMHMCNRWFGDHAAGFINFKNMPNHQYYRNKTEIKRIDPHSLWELKNNQFILVDDDQFIHVPESEKEKFYPDLDTR